MPLLVVSVCVHYADVSADGGGKMAGTTTTSTTTDRLIDRSTVFLFHNVSAAPTVKAGGGELWELVSWKLLTTDC